MGAKRAALPIAAPRSLRVRQSAARAGRMRAFDALESGDTEHETAAQLVKRPRSIARGPKTERDQRREEQVRCVPSPSRSQQKKKPRNRPNKPGQHTLPL